jgi:hypothetical protein
LLHLAEFDLAAGIDVRRRGNTDHFRFDVAGNLDQLFVKCRLQTDEEIEQFLVDWPASVAALSPDGAFISSLSCKRQADLVISEISKKIQAI